MSKLTFTLSQLMTDDPCKDGLDRLTQSLGTYSGPTVVNIVDHSGHLTTDDILWCLKLLDLSDLEQRMVCTKVAIFSARSVVNLYEIKYPADPQPRRAIEAAEECVRSEFSAESVERAQQAANDVRAAAVRAVRAAVRAAVMAAVAAAARAAAAAVAAVAWAVDDAIRASTDPFALRAEIKNYLLELLRGYDE